MKILYISKCNQCCNFERNMYHGNCCWHKEVSTFDIEGQIPKKIKTKEIYVEIPKWCPLETVSEHK